MDLPTKKDKQRGAYAFGEILVIVIGVFVAALGIAYFVSCMIDTWHEEVRWGKVGYGINLLVIGIACMAYTVYTLLVKRSDKKELQRALVLTLAWVLGVIEELALFSLGITFIVSGTASGNPHFSGDDFFHHLSWIASIFGLGVAIVGFIIIIAAIHEMLREKS